jgi:hypothetical protein
LKLLRSICKATSQSLPFLPWEAVTSQFLIHYKFLMSYWASCPVLFRIHQSLQLRFGSSATEYHIPCGTISHPSLLSFRTYETRTWGAGPLGSLFFALLNTESGSLYLYQLNQVDLGLQTTICFKLPPSPKSAKIRIDSN